MAFKSVWGFYPEELLRAHSIQQPTPERFFNAINAYEQTEAMKAAVELEIFTAIDEGNTTAATIAKRCEAAERGVRTLCDFLTIHGFLTKEGAQYALAPIQLYSSTGIRRHISAPPLSFCSPRACAKVMIAKHHKACTSPTECDIVLPQEFAFKLCRLNVIFAVLSLLIAFFVTLLVRPAPKLTP